MSKETQAAVSAEEPAETESPIIDLVTISASGTVVEAGQAAIDFGDASEIVTTNSNTITVPVYSVSGTTIEGTTTITYEVESFEEEDESGREWVAVLAVEEEQTPDFRLLKADSLSWRTPPLTLMVNFESSHGGMQGGAKIAGVIESIERDGLSIVARGRFDTGDDGLEAQRLVKEKVLRGVSIDLAVQDMSIEVLEEDEDGFPTKILRIVNEGIILGATITPMQAITSAEISTLGSESDGVRMSEDSSGTETVQVGGSVISGDLQAEADGEESGTGESSEETVVEEAVVAAAGKVFDSSNFRDPQFSQPTPFTVEEDGRIYGHAAIWGSCHIGLDGGCTQAPNSSTEYSYFKLGDVLTENGSENIGIITMSTGHADHGLSPQATMAHYDNTGTIAAYVNVGEDAHGIWVAGQVAGNLTEDDITALSACSLSGDWRRIGGNLELVALLAVNVPGFPVARVKDGKQTSLVSAGYAPDKEKVSAVSFEVRQSLVNTSLEQRVAALEEALAATSVVEETIEDETVEDEFSEFFDDGSEQEVVVDEFDGVFQED